MQIRKPGPKNAWAQPDLVPEVGVYGETEQVLHQLRLQAPLQQDLADHQIEANYLSI